MKKKIVLGEQDAQMLLNYLVMQPYREVFGLVEVLRTAQMIDEQGVDIPYKFESVQ